jgi:succinoglycan biosynthesis protein ExoA
MKEPADTKASPEDPSGFVSVIMPVFNEERHIEATLRTILSQDYPADRFEVIVADGMSSDRTREMVRAFETRDARVRLVDNPGRIVSTGLNRALQEARGEVIVRMDGHSEYPEDYVRRVVELLHETGAVCSGGVLVPEGKDYISKAVAAAYYSPLAIGASMRGQAGTSGMREVDTVYCGCWRRERLLEVGGFDEEMVRNQDDELSFRLRKGGGRIVQSLGIRVRYWVRNSFGKLFRQFAQYGYWKVRVVRKHPRQAHLRHLLPPLFVVALLVTVGLTPWHRLASATLAVLVSGYLLAITAEAFRQSMRSGFRLWPGIATALVSIQIGYGWGFLRGLGDWLFGRQQHAPHFAQITR